jgi:hypothetical protein
MKDQLELIEDAHNIEMCKCPVCNSTDEQCGYCYGGLIYPVQAAMLKKMIQDEIDADNYEPDYDNE